MKRQKEKNAKKTWRKASKKDNKNKPKNQNKMLLHPNQRIDKIFFEQ